MSLKRYGLTTAILDFMPKIITGKKRQLESPGVLGLITGLTRAKETKNTHLDVSIKTLSLWKATQLLKFQENSPVKK